MQNYLKYYYNLDVSSIHQKDDNYYFQKDNLSYIFLACNYDIKYLNNIYEFSNQLIKYGIYTNKIILNRENNICTSVEEKNYILISYYDYLNEKIDLNDVLYFSNLAIGNEKKTINWKELWENKIDYFEYQLNQFGLSKPMARESFAYFAGYVETGIMLLNEINSKNTTMVLSHKRINENQKKYNLYDPFNLIIDFKPRDMAEYFKGQFLQKKNMLDDIINFLNSSGYDNEEYQLFFVRMLYPSFYFDNFEMVMDGIIEDETLAQIISLKDNYENLIQGIYDYIIKVTYIPKIEWLIKR